MTKINTRRNTLLLLALPFGCLLVAFLFFYDANNALPRLEQIMLEAELDAQAVPVKVGGGPVDLILPSIEGVHEWRFAPSRVPAGPIWFDRTEGGSWTWRYQPSERDTEPFFAKFIGERENQPPVVHAVRVAPQQSIQEYQYVSDAGTLNDRTEYTLITETISPSTRLFNTAQRHTRTVMIAGIDVVFAKDENVYTKLHEAQDVEKVLVFAERVLIKDRLHLPQTEITIYAQRVEFVGPAAQLATTPLPWRTEPEQFRNGHNGHDAGDITVIGAQIDLQSTGDTPAVRFDLSGGDGQRAGAGRGGRDGQSRDTSSKSIDFYLQADSIRSKVNPNNVFYVFIYGGKLPNAPKDRVPWPQNGEDAKFPGWPGLGGDGGTLSVSPSVDVSLLEKLTNVSGGAPGARARNAKGGAAGKPDPAVIVTWRYSYEPAWQAFVPKHNSTSGNARQYARHPVTGKAPSHPGRRNPTRQIHEAPGDMNYFTLNIQPGRDADAPVPVGEAQVGEVKLLVKSEHARDNLPDSSSLTQWLRPQQVERIAAWLDDALLAEQHETVRRVGQVYLAAVEQSPWANEPEGTRLASRLKSVTLRSLNNLDYYGNPAGWVPGLSLDALVTIYREDLETSLEILYLTRWLNRFWKHAEDRTAAIAILQKKTRQQIARATAKINQFREAVPQLQSEISALANEAQFLEQKRSILKQSLLRQAESTVESRYEQEDWRKALGAMGGVMSMVPVGQPQLGLMGQGMTMMSELDTDGDPLHLMYQASRIYNTTFSRVSMDQVASQIDRDLDALDPSTAIDPNAASEEFKRAVKMHVESSAGRVADYLPRNPAESLQEYARRMRETVERTVKTGAATVLQRLAPRPDETLNRYTNRIRMIIDEQAVAGSDAISLKISPRAGETLEEFSHRVSHIVESNIDAFPDLDISAGAEGRRIEAYVDHASQTANSFSDAYKELRTTLAHREVPRTEVEAELQRLVRSDERFQSLAREMQAFQAKHAQVVERLQNTMKAIDEALQSKAEGFANLDALRADLDDAQEVLQENVMAAVDRMERRAKDRINYYKYLVIKAYEYRMLRPFNNGVQEDALYKKLDEMTASKELKPLGAEEEINRLAQLKNVFEADLRRILGEVIEDITKSERGSLMETKRTHVLTNAQLQTLNEDGVVEIVLDQTSITDPTFRDARIIDVQFISKDGKPLIEFGNVPAAVQNVQVTASPGRESRFYTKSRDLLFRHPGDAVGKGEITGEDGERRLQVRWGSTYSAGLGTFSSMRPVLQQEFIESLLNLEPGKSLPRRMLFCPSARGSLIIRKRDTTTEGGSGQESIIDKMTIAVYLETRHAADSERMLRVEAPSDVIISVVSSDLANRSDGRGTFTRRFGGGRVVRLTAPARLDGRAFSGWTSYDGRTLGVDHELLAVRLDDALTVVRAEYGE